MKRLGIAALILFTVAGCGPSRPETLVDNYDEKEMAAAIQRAKSEVDQFIAELKNPTGTEHGVKAPISQGERVEYFWLSDISYSNGQFSGTIANEPGVVTHVEMGQKWTLGKDEIADWMYLKNGKMYGNYTMRPLLKSLPKEEADMYRAMLAEPEAEGPQ